MDYKKKYLKYKLKYLTTKKMLTGGDRHEKNNNNDCKDSQVRSKKKINGGGLLPCWSWFGCENQSENKRNQSENKRNQCENKRKTLKENLNELNDQPASTIIKNEPFNWETVSLEQFWEQKSRIIATESPSETEEKAIEKQQNDIDTLEKHAKYIAEHYYRYRSLKDYSDQSYNNYKLTIIYGFDPINIIENLKDSTKELPVLPNDFVMEILRLTFKKWAKKLNNETKKKLKPEIEMKGAFQITHYNFEVDDGIKSINPIDRASVYAKAFYKELRCLMPEIEDEQGELKNSLQTSPIYHPNNIVS